MNKLPPESRPLRWTIHVVGVAFIIGFFAVLGMLEWLIARVNPGHRWWDISHLGMAEIVISVCGGLGFAGASMLILSRARRRR